MPRIRASPKELFLSHSNHDRAFALKLAATLRQHGVPTWHSESNIRGGQQWHDEIGAALERCDWFAVVLSPDSVKSEWVKRELLFALSEDRLRRRILPLHYRTTVPKRLSWTLSQYQIIDFRKRYEPACRELLRIWGIGLRV